MILSPPIPLPLAFHQLLQDPTNSHIRDLADANASRARIPSKRRAAAKDQEAEEGADVEEQEDDDDEPVKPRKRPSLGGRTQKSMILDSEEEEEEQVSPAKKKPVASKKSAAKTQGKGKKKKSADEDDFSMGSGEDSGSDSEDYFDDGLDEALANASDDAASSSSSSVPTPKAKSSSKPRSSTAKPSSSSSKAQSTLAATRPALKSSASGSGGLGAIKTAAELSKEKEKQQKKANETAYGFLAKPKDADGVPHSEPGADPRTLYIPSAAWKTFTPFEKQFWEIKQNHFDTVLFFQKGKFFELYEDDARIGHSVFDLKLTDRVKMAMVGVPESSFDFWAAKFLAQGYKVGRVDQSETALGAEIRNKDAKAAGGKGKAKAGGGKEIVRRELKSVLTSGTIVDGTMLTDDMSNHCVAIKEEISDSTGLPTFGVCVLDASTAEFSLSHFDDDVSRTQLETLIRQLKPKEIIHQKSNLSVPTLRLLRNCLGIDCQWSALKEGKEFLRSDDAKEEVLKLFKAAKKQDDQAAASEDDLVPEDIRKMYDKPLAMSSLGGMVWYLRQLNLDSELVTANNFNVYDPLSRGKALVLDGQTLAHIEVLQNSQGGTEGTLFQLLSRCITPFGKRLFKVWLCAPLRDVPGINDRLDAVEDLLANSNFAAAFDNMVRKLPDLERKLSRVHAKTCRKSEFIEIVAAFEKIADGMKNLADLCEDFKSTGVPALVRDCPKIGEMLSDLQDLYESDELLPVDGKDEEYERIRQRVEDIETELQGELKAAQKRFKDTSIQFKDIGTKDIFQIEVPNKHKVPGNWVKMTSTQKVNRYYSPEVSRLVTSLKEARERKGMVVNNFQFKLYGEFDKDYSTWMTVVRTIAQLDCLMSLSKSSAALGEPCVRPEIVESDQAILEFEELRHPCVLSASTDFIPNDVAIGGDAQNLMLLTGPNMAGKSTMLRMTCTAVIMAQLGCFVPAAKARIAPVDAIYSRMGANDFIFANASTFKVEMDDCNKILTKATPRSLVILDELGRGTSTYDGMAIAYSVLHRLATHVGCVGFFATHFTSLTEDFAYHPEIRCCNMQTHVNDETREVVFLYKLVDGAAPKSYGPHVASMAGLSDTIVERAIAISKQFETTSKARERQQRANESLPLTSQADAAFLMQLAELKVSGFEEGIESRKRSQLRRTLAIMKKGFEAQKTARTVIA
ncbi:mismatch repair ATPase MSH6 [Sporobolomyces salmoneus]|uniref:mismatch repair ATPase MSH6 n=1 Tax=Sporobolomyces salmoneus TaxID=183962 RepID=UPI00317BFBCB